MKINFVKMHGAGNDYIYINCLEKEIENPQKLSVILSDRHFGVGSDGVILICKSDIADVKMRMFNLDGSEGKMCGNGIRCVAKYVYDNKIVVKDTITVETLSGIKTIEIAQENGLVKYVTVNMGKAELNPKLIPVALDGEKIIDKSVKIGDNKYNITCVSMGNPHAVVFGGDPDLIELEKVGPLFEKNEIFPESVNTEFIQVIDDKTLKMRVWERGSGETLACGTGTCASVVAAVLNGYCTKGEEVNVKLRGGEVFVKYTDEAVFLRGGCVTVFKGEVDVEL